MITIEALAPADFDLVANWLARSEINRWLTGEWRSGQATSSLVAVAVRNRRNRLFLIRHDERPCGLVGLAEIDTADKVAMLWYFLGEDDFAGRGVVSQAVRLLSQLAFKELHLEVLYAWMVESNVRSRRVLERSGFQECGRIPRAASFEGRQVDRIYFALPAGELPRAPRETEEQGVSLQGEVTRS